MPKINIFLSAGECEGTVYVWGGRMGGGRGKERSDQASRALTGGRVCHWSDIWIISVVHRASFQGKVYPFGETTKRNSLLCPLPLSKFCF